MSFFDEVAGFFGGAISGIADLAKRVWNAITAVWSFLTSVGTLVYQAWDWMVNGVLWFAQEAGRFAYVAGNTLWHIATHVIPHAVGWALEHAIHWAERELAKLWHWIEHHVAAIYHWATHELGKLWGFVEHHVNDLLHRIAGAWRWIEHVGHAAAELVLHPERLAEWLAAHIVVPVVKWLIGAGRDVLVWASRTFRSELSPIAHLLEDVLDAIL